MAERDEEAAPTVIVSHLSVTYQVLGGERRGAPSNEGERRSLRQLLRPDPGERTREVKAVKDVSFVARHGESIGIIGHNGSGKSTLLRAVSGLIPPTEGQVWTAGEPSLLGVNAVLINKLSGARNVYVGGQALGLTTAEIDEKFDDIVEFSGIGEAIHLPMSTYSSGMGARLRFAISTAAAPDVLMIDEALATGDAAFREKSTARIAQIREEAGTVFLVSHSNSSIRQICDRVLWMDHGQLIMDGPTEQVLAAYEATLPQSQKGEQEPEEEDPEVPGTVRWSGKTSFQVVREISRATWPAGVPGCFVVSVKSQAVGRMVAPIAARLGWPLLWVRPGGLPGATSDELARLAPERVVVVGGEGSVSPDTFTRIERVVPGTMERLGDDDTGRTAGELLRAFPPEDTSRVYLTRSDNPARTTMVSLVAAVTGRAVTAGNPNRLREKHLSALADLRPERLVLIGYEEEWPEATVERLREATGAEIAYSTDHGPMAMAASLWEGREPGGRVILAGPATVELLSAIAVSGHTDTPLLLANSGRLSDVTRAALERLSPEEVALCGTLESLPPQLRGALGEELGAVHA